MKQNQLVLSLALLAALAACSRILEEKDILADAPVRQLTAVLESPATKTSLEGPVEGIYYPFWSEEDQLAVYVDRVNAPGKYTLAEGAGTSTGVFEGTLSGNKLVALYPFAMGAEGAMSGNVLSLELPAVQQYTPGTFASGAYPMLAVSESVDFQFKNLCAVLHLSLTGTSSVNSITFRSHDENAVVSGKATVRTDYADQPELVMGEGSTELTLDCGDINLREDVPTDFFLVLPAGTYKGGFTVEIKTFTGTVTKSTQADVTFRRSELRSIPTFDASTDGEIDPDNIPYNQIWYKTADAHQIQLLSGYFDANIISHTYDSDWGVLLFDGPVTRIGSDNTSMPFYGYDTITDIRLPDSVELIAYNVFENAQIESFRTPSSLKTVLERAFFQCSRLARIYGPLASEDEKGLILPDGTLAAYAYSALDPDLVIPEGTVKIKGSLFFDNQVVETVSLPSSVTDVEWYAFYNCTSLREFRGESPVVYDSRSLVTQSGDLVAVAGSGLVDYVIPEEVILIPDAFSGCGELKSITFPNTLKMLWYGYGSFSSCNNLEFFYGPGTTEDHHGFTITYSDVGRTLYYLTPICPKDYRTEELGAIVSTSGNRIIERLTLNDEITYIEDRAFTSMPSLRYLCLPSALSRLGSNTFYGCPSLDSLYVRSIVPPSYSEDDYGHFGHDGLHIYVPMQSVEQYKSASGWSNYAQYIEGYAYEDIEEPDYYVSTDYSQDGEVTVLQEASEGKGIDLVLMGDAFTDQLIADGTYDAVMQKMADAFFSEEPYATYRDLFNIYTVKVVSATEGYDHPGQTALEGWFGEGTSVGGNDAKCMEYAQQVVSSDRMDEVLIIVAMNSTAYAGTCWMYYPRSGDYGNGPSVAYFPIGTDDEGLAQLVHHEAGGHGFSKLADEYAYKSMGAIPQEEKDNHLMLREYGWYMNVDYTNDPTEVLWSKFLTDNRYQYDGLGVYEGGATYWTGVWRPTDNSIMRYNFGGYNAPSRERIWIRIHKLAYGADWEYKYEDFVAYDAKNRKTASSAATRAPLRIYPPTHAPVVVPRHWDDPVPQKRQNGKFFLHL